MTTLKHGTPRRSPYQGLEPYTEADYAYFFGRDQEITTIAANLSVARLTLFYGPSGVGKSSVLRAGVLHQLQQQAQANLAAEGRPQIIPVYFKQWHDNPLVALTRQIQRAAGQLDPALASLPPVADAALPPFATLVARLTAESDSDLLLILDQFEEYFLYAATPGADDFAQALIAAVNSPALRVNFLLGLREDALARLDHFKGRIPFLLDNRLSIGHLDRAAGYRAVIKPLERFNQEQQTAYIIEPSLVTAVLDQVGSGQVALSKQGAGGRTETHTDRIEAPYLQLVLTRLWEQEQATVSPCLRQSTLDALGGASTIVQNYLDDTLAALSPAEHDLAARFFDRLVTPSGAKIALSKNDLIGIIKADSTSITSLLQTLLSQRILRDLPSTKGEAYYEITHDVLGQAILAWKERYILAEAEAQRLAQKRRWQQEFLSELRRVHQTTSMDSTAKIYEFANHLLTSVQQFTSCDYVILFISSHENDTALLPIAYVGLPLSVAAKLPYFHLNEAVNIERELNIEIEAVIPVRQQQRLLQNGLRGENSRFFDNAGFITLAELDNQYRSVLIYGPFAQEIDHDWEKDFMTEIGRIVSWSVFSEVRLNNLRISHEQWRDTVALMLHQLRTAITPIYTLLDSTRSSLEENVYTDTHIESAIKNLGTLQHLCINLGESAQRILYSPLTAIERDDLKFEIYPLSVFVTNCAEAFNEAAQQRHRQLFIDNSVDYLPIAEFDFSTLRIVLSNLIDNAIKFSFPHTTINVSAGVSHSIENVEYVQIQIESLGDSFFSNEEQQIRQTDRMLLDEQTIKSVAKAGLGLLETYVIVKAHQGYLQVTTKTSTYVYQQMTAHNTIITLTLPLKQNNKLNNS